MQAQVRISSPVKIDRRLIEKELKAGKLVIVQFPHFSHQVYSDTILADLDSLCHEHDDNLCVRFYGSYDSAFDCKTLLKIPHVKCLCLECDYSSHPLHLETVTELKHLSRLHLSVWLLRDTELFQAENFRNLKEFSLGPTKTKAINLSFLEAYEQLTHLSIGGHTKNIDIIGKLANLQSLDLYSISKARLDFINKLKRLNGLKLMLGGRENIHEIEMNSIETLEITRVRGFGSFGNISNFPKLKSLFIQDQIQMASLRFDAALRALESITLFNCKKFHTLTGLEKLSALHELKIFGTDIDFDEFIRQDFPSTLKTLSFHTGRSKIDRDIEDRLSKLGYKEH